MAEPSDALTAKSLSSFSASLEDLTFNSKPIIDDLTRFAGTSRQFAPQIAQKIEERILEVRPEWKLPSLYLLDSILKNIKGDYLVIFSKKIVQIFCHCFEKLVDADSRKALYRLRLTWPQYFANRKLALIDKHVKALDPNWPVTAVEEDPPSPTIFVNPEFLKPNDKNSLKTNQAKKSERKVSPKKETTPPKKVGTNAPSPKKTATTIKDSKKAKEESMTIQEKRKKLLEEKRSERIRQQEAMGLSPEHPSKKPKRRSPRPHGSPGQHSINPLKVPSPKARARSASPFALTEKANPANRSQERMIRDKEVTPPPEKRPKLDTKRSKLGAEDNKPVQKSLNSKKTSKNGSHSPDNVGSSSSSMVEPRPIKESQLQLDDLPPELLPKHHELILKQIEAQLKSGNLTSEQHNTLCKQLNELYELQRRKEDEESRAKSQSPSSQPEQTNKDSIPSDDFISLTDNNKSNSTFFVDTDGRNDNFDFGPGRGGRHDYHGRPHPHFEPPPEGRFYSRRPPGPYRDNPRPPFRGRRGPYPPRGPRGPRGHRYFDEYNGPPPPPMGPGRGHMTGRPPPPWREPPPPQGGEYGMPPGQGPRPPPPVNVSNLFNRLVDFGMIEGGGAQHRTSQQAPATVPTLSFNVGTLKQRYSSLISLLHVGEQCSTCGVRFPNLSSDEYRKHLDWHYSLNRNEGQVNSSRNWFIHPEDWLKYEELSEESQEKESTLKPSVETQEQEEVTAPNNETVSSCSVLPGESNEVCTTCQEPLEQFWEDELDEWHFKNAIRSSTGKLYHTFCFQDAKEDDFNASNSSAQLASPEMKH